MSQFIDRVRTGSLVQFAIALIAVIAMLCTMTPQQSLALEQDSSQVASAVPQGSLRFQEGLEARNAAGASTVGQMTFGLRLSAPEDLLAPAGIAVDKSGHVYVVAAGNDRIDIYAGNGSFLESWGDTGSGPGEFVFHDSDEGWSYGDIAIDDGGNFYVADPGNQRVQVFNPDREYVKTIQPKVYTQSETVREKLGYVDPTLVPAGLAVDYAADRLYIADADSDTVKIYRLNGTFVSEWGLAGTDTPKFGDLFDIAVADDGSIWVPDFARSLLFHISATGEQLEIIGSHGGGAGQFMGAAGMAVGENGTLFVADYLEGTVQVITNDGAFTHTIGADFGKPTYVTVAADGSVWVSYEDNNTVARYVTDPMPKARTLIQ